MGSFKSSEGFENMVNNTSYRYDNTEGDLIDHCQEEPAHIQVNIYESDEDNSPRSRSPTQSRSLLEPEKQFKGKREQDIEMQMLSRGKDSQQLQGLLSKNTSDLTFHQLQERCLHFERTSHIYEKLYIEYLEKYVLSSRDKELILHEMKRTNCIISKTAGVLA